MTLYGWDASDFDWPRGPMDLGAAVRDGIVFFTHKATEGTKVVHAHYGEALNRANAAGMPFMGAYLVPRTPGNNGHGSIQAQVDFFLSYLDSQTPWWRTRPEFFVQVDTEHWGYDDVPADIGAAVCAELGKRTNKLRVHYAPRWAYGDTITGTEPLWASSYGTNPAVPYRDAYPGDTASGWAPYSGRTPTFLQYGSRLTIGSQPTCDGNAFRGTIEQLRALITGGVPDMDPNAQDIVHGISNAEALRDIWDIVVGGRPGVSGVVSRFQAPNGWAMVTDAVKAQTKPAVTLSDADRKAIVDAVVAHPDTPLSDADKPVIAAALAEFFAAHFPPAPKPIV